MDDSLLRTSKEVADIYNEYVTTVYRICFIMLKNSSEAEDATQNVFIRFMQYEKQFDSDAHLKAWLIVTAKNICKDMFKNWWKSKRIDLESVEEVSYISQTSYDSIWEQVKKLPQKYRLPIYLFYYEGYSTEEISKILETNHATIRTRLHTARKKLKLMLEEEF